AVARVDDIARAKGVHHADRDRLLADRKMDEPRDLARADELGDALLEGTQQPHAPEERATDRSGAGGSAPRRGGGAPRRLPLGRVLELLDIVVAEELEGP